MKVGPIIFNCFLAALNYFCVVLNVGRYIFTGHIHPILMALNLVAFVLSTALTIHLYYERKRWKYLMKKYSL
jgi:hypothetical protein